MEKIKLDRNFERKLKKALKQLDRQHENEFVPCTTSLMKMCEIAGKPQHYNWIVNLITKKCEENESYYDYLRLNSDFMVCLDKDGLFLFSDILSDFFGLDNVRGLWQYMNALDEYEHTCYGIKQYVHTLSDEKLESLKNDFTKDHEADRLVLGIINAEQECRKHPITRKINELLKPKGIM